MTTVMYSKAEAIGIISDSRRLKESRRQMKGGERERERGEDEERGRETKVKTNV